MGPAERRCAIDYDTVPPGLWVAPRLRHVEDLTPGVDHRHFVLGRAALLWLCRALGWGRGDRVLMPAYTCESLVDPFVAEGVTIDFYAVGRDLTVDLDDIRRRLPGARGGVLIHPFGWPQPPEVRRWLAARSPSDGYWIEDVTHSPFTMTEDSPLGRGGDAVLMSYRKLFPCADGCVLSFRGGAPAGQPRFEAPLRYRGHALLRYARMAIGGATHVAYRRRGSLLRSFDTALRELRIHPPIQVGEMSVLTRHLLERFDVAGAILRRRANAGALLRAVADVPGVVPLFADLPAGVVPGLLPIRVLDGRRDALRDLLHRRAIEAHFHWRRPKELPAGQHPVADQLRAELLSLPVDERYEVSDMERIALVIRGAMTSAAPHIGIGRSLRRAIPG